MESRFGRLGCPCRHPAPWLLSLGAQTPCSCSGQPASLVGDPVNQRVQFDSFSKHSLSSYCVSRVHKSKSCDLKLWIWNIVVLTILKSVCRSGSNSENWTWNNRLVSNRKRSMSRLYIVTSMQSTSWETLGWKKHKLESRLLGEISITSDMQMSHPYGTKWRTKEPLDESERGELKSCLKAQHSEN